jgi:hypothetical protein
LVKGNQIRYQEKKVMSAPQHHAMEWIATTDELPDETQRVLLFTPYQVLGEDHTCVGNRESIATCIARVNRKQVPVFTHWMPLPPTPQQCA